MNEEYISNQIAVYKNSKTLVELQDKLKVASMYSYAHIHADGELAEDGRKTHSLIGILMKDYSNGTGDKAVTVTANLSPEEVKFILLYIEKHQLSEVKSLRNSLYLVVEQSRGIKAWPL